MPKYKVTIDPPTESYEIESVTKEEAIRKAEEMYIENSESWKFTHAEELIPA